MIETKEYRLRPIEELDPFKDKEKLYSWFMQLNNKRELNAIRLEHEGNLRLISQEKNSDIYLTALGTVIEIKRNVELKLYGKKANLEETESFLEKLIEGTNTQVMEAI